VQRFGYRQVDPWSRRSDDWGLNVIDSAIPSTTAILTCHGGA
jgi:hypothetical protein